MQVQVGAWARACAEAVQVSMGKLRANGEEAARRIRRTSTALSEMKSSIHDMKERHSHSSSVLERLPSEPSTVKDALQEEVRTGKIWWYSLGIKRGGHCKDTES